MPRKRKPDFTIAWTTITYRSVILAIVGVGLLLLAIGYFVFPNAARAGLEALGQAITRLAGNTEPTKKSITAGPQQAHFTNLEGTVRVKKSNSNSWTGADYSTPLERGDVVQTSSEGMAKVVFADGTNYTIKQDSLIVIEENSADASQKTNVAVQVTTGTVDLATARYQQGSKSAVIVSGATAALSPESSAMVRNNPRADVHEILLKRGSGEVTRNGEVVRLADYEKVSFKSDSPEMVKVREISPPTLITPSNMAPIFVAGSARPVQFSWTPVPNVQSFRVRISRNPFFSSTVFDHRVKSTTDIQVPGLAEGAYYWLVQSVDAAGKESIESEKNRFTIIPKGNDTVSLALELMPFVQHGHVIEVKGKTEFSARVMVNGSEVPVIASDGTFHFFTPPLPEGENVITVTAQNARGGVNTQQKKVVIQ